MNANELADCLQMTPVSRRFMKTQAEAATMLRKLQDENTTLLFHIDIQKVVGSDLDIAFLKAVIRERDVEIEALERTIKGHEVTIDELEYVLGFNNTKGKIE